MPRAARKRKRKQHEPPDLGPASDPIRQQGRDPRCWSAYREGDWSETPQLCDRSRRAGQRRKYHRSSFTSRGFTYDQMFEDLADMAAKFEAAGIDLGQGGIERGAIVGSVQADVARKYGNVWHKKRGSTPAA